MTSRLLRSTGTVVSSLLLVACGLTLDARPHTDAGATRDARAMDAQPSPEDAAREEGGMDAPASLPDVLVAHDDAGEEVIADAFAFTDDVNASRPDATSPTDTGTDAAAHDASVRDAAVLDAAVRDAAVRDALTRDAPACSSAADCLVITTTTGGEVSCQDTACSEEACVPSGAAFDCPPAGGCARACGRDAFSGAAVCRREGTLCAGLGDACDVDGQCATGLTCSFFRPCTLGMCLPRCSSAEADTVMTITVPGIGTVVATCNGSAYVPDGFSPPWCAIAVP